MGRFDENEEFQDEEYFEPKENDENEISEEEYANFLQQTQIQLAEHDRNQRVLSEAIRILERSFLWRFRSIETKLRLITRIYKNLQKLIMEPD